MWTFVGVPISYRPWLAFRSFCTRIDLQWLPWPHSLDPLLSGSGQEQLINQQIEEKRGKLRSYFDVCPPCDQTFACGGRNRGTSSDANLDKVLVSDGENKGGKFLRCAPVLTSTFGVLVLTQTPSISLIHSPDESPTQASMIWMIGVLNGPYSNQHVCPSRKNSIAAYSCLIQYNDYFELWTQHFVGKHAWYNPCFAMPSQSVCQDLMAGVENSMNTKNKEPLDPLDALNKDVWGLKL